MKLKLKMEPELGQSDGSGSSQIPPAPGGFGRLRLRNPALGQSDLKRKYFFVENYFNKTLSETGDRAVSFGPGQTTLLRTASGA